MAPRRPKSAKKKQQRQRSKPPFEFDFEKADRMLERIVRENIEWLKEMAKK